MKTSHLEGQLVILFDYYKVFIEQREMTESNRWANTSILRPKPPSEHFFYANLVRKVSTVKLTSSGERYFT